MPRSPIEMAGKTFSKWTVSHAVKVHSNGELIWFCHCKCGNTAEIVGGALRRGASRQCKACASKAISTHGMSGTPEFKIWVWMLDRCTNVNSPSYAKYGGRGISVCERWGTFESFHADMGNRPTPEHSIERVNNDLGYGPDNCVWATRRVQMRNTRRNRKYAHVGEALTLVEWGERLEIDPNTLWMRIHGYDWSVERALTTPVQRR